ncbi:MAG: cysteine desulfurase [Deltaproteobacteria bacterium]|nr:cysteine desulfurase [Deltaproteobacteria bacterium]
MMYFDHNAGAPLLDEVRAALAEALAPESGVLGVGNPSSIHGAGRRVRDAVERARAEIALLAGVDEGEVVLTSGGTEACQLGVLGLARVVAGGTGGVLVTSPLEHPCVVAACARLAGQGWEVRQVALGEGGRVTADAVAAALAGTRRALVALSAVNHEVGNRTDVAALVEVVRAAQASLFVDAVQAAGKQRMGWGVDALALSGHKLGGPAGSGALVVRRGVALEALVEGGKQERGRRGGTENVLGAIGFAAAARAVRLRGLAWRKELARLRDELQARLLEIPGARVVGDLAARDEGTLSVGFAGAPGEVVVQSLDLEGVCVSTGAACSSGTLEPSPVVRAIAGEAAAREAVRLSLGWGTTAAEVERVAGLLPAIVARIRAALAE